MDLREALTGISGILVTPFDDSNEIAPEKLEPIIEKCILSGVDAFTVNGNTSEFYSLTSSEAERIQAEIPSLVDGRAVIIAGVGRGVVEASRLAARAGRDGAAAVMVHQPPDPFVSPRGVVSYVERVSEAADVPIVLYLRSDGIGRDTIETLAATPGVVAVKWASPDLAMLSEIRRAVPDVLYVCGLAEMWAPAMYAVGAEGFTSGLINVAPELSVAVLGALRDRDLELAEKLLDDIAPFEALRAEEQNGANVSIVKAALALVGLDCGPTRPPSAWPIAEPALARLAALLEAWELAGVPLGARGQHRYGDLSLERPTPASRKG